jgi:hypothetical protein
VNYQWADGFRPPEKVSASAVRAALDALEAPTPENLLEASKRKRHVLHADLWTEGDQAWAQRARLDRCRHIIGAIVEPVVVGGKTIIVRSVEYVRVNGEGTWATLADIRNDPELRGAYVAEVQRLQEQALGKLAKLRELMGE